MPSSSDPSRSLQSLLNVQEALLQDLDPAHVMERLCDETRTDPRVNRDAYTDMGAGSLLVVPLLRGGQAFGAFEVTARRPYSFTDEDVTLLNHVFSFVSVVISS